MKTYEMTISPVQGIIKSPAIWETEGGGTRPLVYFRKPKGVTEDEFYKLLRSLEITIMKGVNQ